MKDDKKPISTKEEDQLVPREPEQTQADKDIEDFVSDAPPEVQKLLKKAPPDVRREFMAMVMKTSMGGGLPHPLFDKFTAEHVGKFLDLNEEDSKRSFIFASKGRWFQLGYVLIALAFLVFVIVYLMPAHKDLVISLITILMAFAGGFGVGYGYKARK